MVGAQPARIGIPFITDQHMGQPLDYIENQPQNPPQGDCYLIWDGLI
jgi:hypothetical protein